METISIIMPLYNAAKYLPEALQCILDQTYRDFELICINDGSTDGTAEILMNFQRNDSRIKVMNNEKRLGAGPSRNKGLKVAQGKFVIFLDGDDVFYKKLLEITCEAMERFEADVVLFDVARDLVSEDIHTERIKKYSQEFISLYCEKPFCINDFPARKFPLRSGSIGDKMFLKSFIMEQRLEFQNLPSSNDVYFVRMALYCARKVIWARSEKILLYTRKHSELSRISNYRDPMCRYYAWRKIVEELIARNMLENMQKHYCSTFARALLNRLQDEEVEEERRKFYIFLQKEGIDKCVKHTGIVREKVDDYTMYLLDGIRENAYESGWLEAIDTCFQFYIKKRGESLCRLLEEKLAQNKKIVLWGVGIDGTFLLKYLTENSIRIFGIVDCDEKKQGTIVCGYEIGRPNFMCPEADYILVTSQEVYWEVSIMVKDTGVKLINLMDLLTEG